MRRHIRSHTTSLSFSLSLFSHRSHPDQKPTLKEEPSPLPRDSHQHLNSRMAKCSSSSSFFPRPIQGWSIKISVLPYLVAPPPIPTPPPPISPANNAQLSSAVVCCLCGALGEKTSNLKSKRFPTISCPLAFSLTRLWCIIFCRRNFQGNAASAVFFLERSMPSQTFVPEIYRWFFCKIAIGSFDSVVWCPDHPRAGGGGQHMPKHTHSHCGRRLRVETLKGEQTKKE